MAYPRFLTFTFLLLFTSAGFAADISSFIGSYTGSANVEGEGEASPRDMSVNISATKNGYAISWKTVIHKSDGRNKETEYDIPFLSTGRTGIYSSAMKTNLFGKPVPLNPLKGDPYIWSRITEDTLTVYALVISEDGGYEMLEYNRTLTPGGLNLDFLRIRDGVKLKNIKAFLKKTQGSD